MKGEFNKLMLYINLYTKYNTLLQQTDKIPKSQYFYVVNKDHCFTY